MIPVRRSSGVDVHDHVGRHAGGDRGLGQVPRVLGRVRRLNEAGVPTPEAHGPLDLERRDVGGRHQHALDAVLEHHLGLAHLGGADPDGAARDLEARDLRAFVSLGVRPGCDAVA